MENRNRHIDDLFREGLDNHSETPPAMAWDALEKRLDAQKERRRPFLWWYVIGVALLALLGYYIAHTLNNKTKKAATISTHADNTRSAVALYKDGIAKQPNARSSTDLSLSGKQAEKSGSLRQHDINRKNKDKGDQIALPSSKSHKHTAHGSRRTHKLRTEKGKLANRKKHVTAKQVAIEQTNNNTSNKETAATSITRALTSTKTGNPDLDKKRNTRNRKPSTITTYTNKPSGNKQNKAHIVSNTFKDKRSVRQTDNVKKHSQRKQLAAIRSTKNPVTGTGKKPVQPTTNNIAPKEKDVSRSIPRNNSSLLPDATISKNADKDIEAHNSITENAKTKKTASEADYKSANTQTRKTKRNKSKAQSTVVEPLPVGIEGTKVGHIPVDTLPSATTMSSTAKKNKNNIHKILSSKGSSKKIDIDAVFTQEESIQPVQTKTKRSPKHIAATRKKSSDRSKLRREATNPIDEERSEASNEPVDVKPTNTIPKTLNIKTAKGKKKTLNTESALATAKPIDVTSKAESNKPIDISAKEAAPKPINVTSAKSKKKSPNIQPASEGLKKPIQPVPALAHKKHINITPASSRQAKNVQVIAAEGKKTKHIDPIPAHSKHKEEDLEANVDSKIKTLVNNTKNSRTNKGTNVANAHNDDANRGDMTVNMTAKKESRNIKNVPEIQNGKPVKKDILAIDPMAEPIETFVQPKTQTADREQVPDYLKIKDNDVGGSEGVGAGKDMPNFEPRPKKKFHRFEMGLKAGGEWGTSSNAANKTLVAPFFEYNINDRLGFVIQPSLKFANITNTQVSSATNSYYNRTYDWDTIVSHTISVSPTFPFDTSYKTVYRYRQRYDSLTTSGKLNKTKYLEVEIPVLGQYKVVKNLFILGGISVIYSTVPAISTTAKVVGSKQLDSIVTIVVPGNNPAIPPPPDPSSIFTHNGVQPFSAYNPNAQSAESKLRFGYTIGFSYALKERLLFDFMIQQNLSKIPGLQDQNLKDIYTQPYLHLTIGYKLYRSRSQ